MYHFSFNLLVASQSGHWRESNATYVAEKEWKIILSIMIYRRVENSIKQSAWGIEHGYPANKNN